MKKMSEVTKSRIWLYGSLFVIFLALAMFINVYNYTAIIKKGMALTTEKTIEATHAAEPRDLAALAQSYKRELVFQSQDVEQWLSEGKAVIVDASADENAPVYYIIMGADGAAFTAFDADGAPAELPGKVYRCYVQDD